MEIYLLKSAACLAILFTFYKLFLERESFHVFKRFYLLAALTVSFAIPFITFTQYVEPDLALGSFQNPILENIYYPETVTDTSIIEKTYDWTSLLWIVYGLGVLFFGIRFLLNLSRIVKRIQSNPKTKRQSFINVLLNDLVIPHTFFNYIFLNKSKFEKREIPKEVLLHEQTHAKQKHSIDILLIEILQVVFWFNPLIYLLKNTVKLNHEFLADQAVMNQGVNPSTYQQLLLAFSSNASEPQLANAINYSSIKKRFTVMKTQTSKKTVWIKSLILLPLLCLITYGFSTKNNVVKADMSSRSISPFSEENNLKNSIPRKDVIIMITLNEVNINGNPSSIETFKDDLDSLTKDWEETDYTSVKPNILIASTSKDYLTQLEKEFSKTHLSKANEGQTLVEFKKMMREGNQGATPKELLEFNKLAKQYNALPEATRKIPLTDLKRLETIYRKMTSSQKDNAQPFPNCPSQELQQSASREQMAEYNKLAMHYNAMLKKKDFTIKMKHVERLKYIYGIMSEKQRQDAEPFPDFPKPPPPPEMPEAPKVSKHDVIPPPPLPENATPAQKAKYKKAIEYYKNKKMVPPPPPVPDAPKQQGQYSKPRKINKSKNDANKVTSQKMYDIPPPPSTPDPIAHMKALYGEGAVFYYEGKRIDGKEAIRIAQKNKDINIQVRDHESSQPIVKLSTKPIRLKKSKPKEQANINLKTGNIKIEGKNYFYTTKNGVTSYFNNQGQPSDTYGNKLSSRSSKHPTFYYRGKQILSPTANKLLSRNTSSITLSTAENLDGSYKIILNDTQNNITRNYNNVNHNNSNPNSGNPNNNNLNNNYNNPNSVINLSEVISKGATFFYEDEKITTEKALLLTRSNSIERVQTITGKDGKPKVYFWKKA